MARTGRIAFMAAALIMGVAASGEAQQRPSDSSERLGVEVGRLLISPGLHLSLGYDSNVAFRSEQELVRSSPTFYVLPNLRFRTLNPAMVDASGSFAVGWRQFFAGDQDVNRFSFLEVGGNGEVVINPHGPVSVGINERIRLSNEGAYTVENDDDVFSIPFQEYGMDFSSDGVLVNQVGLNVGVHPGGRNASRMGFSADVGAFHRYYHFIERDSSDRHGVGATLQLNWNPLPHTTFFIDGSVMRTLYVRDISQPLSSEFLNDTIATSRALLNVNSTPVRAGVGVRSLLLPRLGTTLRLGYTNGFYDEGDSPSRVYALGQLEAQFSSWNRLTAGYSTAFADSAFANYINYHRVWVTWQAHISRMQFGVTAFGQINRYAEIDDQVVDAGGNVVEVYSTTNRVDYPVGVQGDIGVTLGPHVVTGVRYRFMANFTDFQAEPAGGFPDDLFLGGDPSFVRHRFEIFLSMRL